MNELQPQNPNSADDVNENSMAMLSAVSGNAEDLGAPADLDYSAMDSGKSIGGGTMILVIVFLVAAGAIYFMRTSQGEIGMSDTAKKFEAKIEQTLAKLVNQKALAPDDPLRPENMKELFGDTEVVLGDLEKNPTDHQVPISHVQKNPFYLGTKKKEVKKVDDKPKGPDPRLLKFERRLRDLNDEFRGLALQTVVGGGRPMAIINGDLLAPGQSAGSFRISKIDKLSVTLSYPKDVQMWSKELNKPLQELKLSMEEKDKKNGRR